MRSLLARACAPIALLALSFAPRPALAQEEEPPPKPRPSAPDTRSWHPTLALGAGWGTLLGKADDTINQSTVSSWGVIPSLTLALPFRRDWAVEAWATRGTFNRGTSDCPLCRSNSLAVGLGAAYHLLDGTPFDPWFSFGAGVSRTHVVSPGFGTNFDFTGIEVLRLAVGGDYYFSPAIGLGPYFDFTVGRYLARSPGPIDQGDGHTAASFGLRIILNPF